LTIPVSAFASEPTPLVNGIKRGRLSLTLEYVAQLASVHTVMRATANREKFGLGYKFISNAAVLQKSAGKRKCR
jgi:hypothetical protein